VLNLLDFLISADFLFFWPEPRVGLAGTAQGSSVLPCSPGCYNQDWSFNFPVIEKTRFFEE
jgi:hypothetical protein